MRKAIFFDMDGTIADLYAVEGWLKALAVDHDPFPYAQAKPMFNMSSFARLLHKAQGLGYKIVILSWLSKNSTPDYDIAVIDAKMEWLEKHLPSVKWDKIFILPHGTPKNSFGNGFLFDDEEQNRNDWNGLALEPYEILDFLRNL